ncbi:hypothetical protein [Mesorhizobium sp. M7A.F.Ca.MR.362.00.0.0]|uniref:hypothetical protein n=1 Tax=Mesorhizobium sp. M7A.F.Ca.MR.362.00.0.0 TaxID=2496779 RepID=UPI000FD4908B|nr:hypothetical protein [Mesorhizobium sp. M7A.F.Ca.MR.362.00.0.0]RUU79987.1 hypothetical protein EOC06_13830 [Mesorhizobium sp. M7A.F.Ca.MR.362.00.0.0]
MGIVLTEPAIVPDIFVSGRLEPEDLGDGLLRFTFFSKQKSIHDNGVEEHVIVARLVMPAALVLANMPSTMKALGVACCGGERLRLAH